MKPKTKKSKVSLKTLRFTICCLMRMVSNPDPYGPYQWHTLKQLGYQEGHEWSDLVADINEAIERDNREYLQLIACELESALYLTAKWKRE